MYSKSRRWNELKGRMFKWNLKKMEKWVPPGVDVVNELKLCLIGLGAAVGYSTSFLVKYITARSELFEWTLKGTMIKEGEKIPYFYQLLDAGMDCSDGFCVLFVVLVWMMLYHYCTYYQGSKSIYLMKRLPDKWELYKRCVHLPLVAIVVEFITIAGVMSLYYGIYLVFTPQQCLPM